MLLAALPIQILATEVLPANVEAAATRFGFDGSGLSVSVVRLRDGQPMLAYNARVPRNPASTIKLLTTLVALDRLGPAYRWQTTLAHTGDETAADLGDVYFVGGGDPYLVEERLYQLVRALKRRGVQRISGDLIVDDSYFTVPPEDTGAFDQQPFRIYNVVPSAALSNFNATRFEFRNADRKVSISADPELPSLQIANQLRPVAGRCAGYRRGVSLVRDSAGQAVFNGRFPTGCKRYAFTRSVMPAWQYTGELFAQLWRQIGGQFDGTVKRGIVPDEAESIVEFSSVSLAEVVRLVNKHSSNVMARHLIYTLAVAAGRDGPTEAEGIAEVRNWLRTNNFEFADMPLENGAGRSRKTRISADQLVALLQYADEHRFAAEFRASMPILGMDGTLDDRLDNTSLAGWGHLKTGSLDDVSALAGYLTDEAGERYAVAVIHNARGSHRGGGEAIQHALLRSIRSQFGSSNEQNARQAAAPVVK